MVRYNITLTADEDFVLRAQWKTKSGAVTAPVDTSEYTATLVFYTADGAIMCEYTCSKDDPIGYISAYITANNLPALQLAARYKLKVTGPTNKVLLTGKVTWQP